MSETIGLELTIWERVACMQVIQQQRGNVGELRTALAILEALDLNEDEAEKIGYEQTPRGPQWSEAWRDYTKNILLTESELQTLRTKITEHESWPVNAGRQVLALVDKLQS